MCTRLQEPQDAPAVIESYVAGPGAKRFGELPKKEVVQIVRREMEKVHPGAGKYMDRAYIKAWSEDPYALGGPSWPAPGDVSSYLKDLQVPEGRLHFAGEHTSILRSTMEGALRSGIRAAKEVHEA